MVVQGVKNPMVDLLSLEDKSLDEVRPNTDKGYTIKYNYFEYNEIYVYISKYIDILYTFFLKFY